MKLSNRIGVIAILLAALSMPAFATKPGNNGGGNGGCGVGQQTNGCGTSGGTVNNGGAGGSGGTGVGVGLGVGIGAAKADSQSKSHSTSMSDAAAASQANGGNVGDLSVSGDSGHTFVAPAPVMTLVPQSSGGIITKSHSVGFGWNLFSWSKSEQETDQFVAGERLAEDFERKCQFESAAMLRQHMAALKFPSYRELPAEPGVVNMTREQCVALRSK